MAKSRPPRQRQTFLERTDSTTRLEADHFRAARRLEMLVHGKTVFRLSSPCWSLSKARLEQVAANDPTGQTRLEADAFNAFGENSDGPHS